MKQIVSKGIILDRTNFGEADRILTILTPDQGKIKAIAKGVRKIKSKLAGGIELFSISQISFIKAKSDIYTLTSTRLEKHFHNITKHIDRTMIGYQVLKTFNVTTEDNTEQSYFVLLSEILTSLNDVKVSIPLIELWQNLQLLKLSGHSPNLKTDAHGNKLEVADRYNFDLQNMSFLSSKLGRYSQKHIKLLRLGISMDSPKLLANISDIDNILPDCLNLTKLMLKQFTN